MNPIALAACEQRIPINEGMRLTRYLDTMGIPTIGVGMNLEREDCASIMAACGVADPAAVILGTASLTQDQAQAIFEHDLPTYIGYARQSLAPGIFDALAPPRQFVVVDLCYNLGEAGWLGFAETRSMINNAQQQKNAGLLVSAHSYFLAAAQHLTASAWFTQVGDRARRDVAMMRAGEFCNPTGDGSDLA